MRVASPKHLAGHGATQDAALDGPQLGGGGL